MFATILIPHFELQAVLRHDDSRERACALVDPAHNKTILVQVNALAHQQGVSVGTTTNQARARCADLDIKSRSATAEKTAVEVLLQTIYSFSPYVEATLPGVGTVDLRGLPERSESAWQAWGRDILRVLASHQLEGCIGFATTPDLALLAASPSRPVNFIQDPQSLLKDLPLHAAGLPAEIEAILERWGLRFVGEVLALERSQLIDRLGPAIGELFDRLSPNHVRPLKLITPSEEFVEEVEFESEIETVSPLLFILQRFVEQLANRLAARQLVVAGLQLQLRLASGQTHQIVIKIPHPTGKVPALFKALQDYLDTIRTDSPIVALRLEALSCRPNPHQFRLFETDIRDVSQFAETLGRISALCGADRVGTPVPELTHRPDTFRVASPDFSQRPAPVETPGPRGPALRRFRPPLTAQVDFHAESPVRIRSQVLNSALTGFRGPFHSSGDWWDTQAWSREEWDAQTSDGTLCRIYRSAQGCFLEGIYD